jgi:hypothetical protein
MLRLLFILLLFSGQYLKAASSSQEEGNHDNASTPTEVQQLMELDELLLQDEGDFLMLDGNDERRLGGSTALCPGDGPVNSFAVRVDFVPTSSVNEKKCTSTVQEIIGIELNALLLDYGIGAAGANDGATFLAAVCVKPTTLKRRRRLQIGFIWKGGGLCQKCSADNGDARRLLRSLQTDYTTWFKDTYGPTLQNVLRKAITDRIVPKYPICFGSSPKVAVEITQATSVPSCT